MYINRDYAVLNFSADPANQFAFLNTTLQLARMANQSVYIVAHAAPGYNEKIGYPNLWPQFNDVLLDVISNYTDIITGQFYGHEHADTFRFSYLNSWYSSPYESAQPNGVMFIAPSVTPWINSTMYQTYPDSAFHNPALRRVFINSNGTVQDIETYFLNLTAANQGAPLDYELEYSYVKDLGAKAPLNALNMWTVYQNIRKYPQLFQRYLSYNSVLVPVNCSANCTVTQQCAILQPYYTSFSVCTNAVPWKQPMWMWIVLGVSIVLIALLALMALACTIQSMKAQHQGTLDETSGLLKS